MLFWFSFSASLSSRGSAWNSREAAKAASITACDTPWPFTVCDTMTEPRSWTISASSSASKLNSTWLR